MKNYYNIFKKESDPFLEKTKWLFIILCVSPVLFMLVYSQFLPSNCEVFFSENLNGVILGKYIDTENHNSMTILLQTKSKTTVKRPLEFQETILFEKLKINDVLEKLSGQNYYIINYTDTVRHVCND